jgi:hypothetical protein
VQGVGQQQIRTVYVAHYRSTLAHMGEGKTRVILPMLSLAQPDLLLRLRLHFLQLLGDAHRLLHPPNCLLCRRLYLPYTETCAWTRSAAHVRYCCCCCCCCCCWGVS